MTQAELIDIFPDQYSIKGRVLLICPSLFHELIGRSVHECRIFLLVMEGSLTIQSGANITRIQPYHLVDLLAWEPVSFLEISDDMKGWCLLPNYIFTNESLNDLKPADSNLFKDRHSIPQLPLTHTEAKTLENQFLLLLNTLQRDKNYYRDELCQSYYRCFMLEAGNIIQHKRNLANDTDRVENRQDTILRSFFKLVWKYYKTEHNVDFYAGKLCLSSKHLSRVVREKLGKTPYAVIRDELLQRASYLLKDTKMSVQEISAELHFSEMAAFCKFFKKHNGLSPTAFRASENRRKIYDN